MCQNIFFSVVLTHITCEFCRLTPVELLKLTSIKRGLKFRYDNMNACVWEEKVQALLLGWFDFFFFFKSCLNDKKVTFILSETQWGEIKMTILFVLFFPTRFAFHVWHYSCIQVWEISTLIPLSFFFLQFRYRSKLYTIQCIFIYVVLTQQLQL